MSILSAHKPEIKSACLSSVSLHVIQLGYGVMPELVCGDVAPVYGEQTSGTWAFLVWIRLWLHWLCGGQDAPFIGQTAHGLNRHERRGEHHAVPPARNLMPYYQLCPKGLSHTQFLEHVCRLSVFGRIRIYRMRQSGSVLQRRALLICYDHGWWRAPIGTFGRVYCGVWYVHVWPGWKLSYFRR